MNNSKKKFTKRQLMMAGIVLAGASFAVFGTSAMYTNKAMPENTTQETGVKARPEITIMINGKASVQSIDEGMAYIAPGTSRVMIPTRIVANDMGFNVDWNQTTKKVTISNAKDTIVLTLNSKYVTVNGVQKTLDAATEMKNNRIYIPVRAVSEALGAQVEWIGGTAKVVNITTGAGTTTKPQTPSNGFVGVGNMVAGQTYKLDQLVTNRVEQYESLKRIVTTSNVLDTSTITVKKGTWGDSVSGITIKAFGWDCSDKLGGAFEYTGNPAYDPRVIFFKGNEILRIEKAFKQKTVNGKTYYLFGDGINRTEKDMAEATHIGFAVPYEGEILIIQKPSNVPNLGV